MSEQKLTIFSPFGGEKYSEWNRLTANELKQKAQLASKSFKKFKKTSLEERMSFLKKGLNYFKQNENQISLDMTKELGKPYNQALGELNATIERAEYMMKFAQDGALKDYNLSEYFKTGFEGTVEYHSKGVIYIIAPWNYPLFCAINGVVSALLTGSCVLLKHTTAPSCGDHFEKAFGQMVTKSGETIFPLQHIIIDKELSSKLIYEEDIEQVIFTGSVESGKSIQKDVAKRVDNDRLKSPFITCSLELGGHDAAYIAQDADIPNALEGAILDGRLHNAGQSCCAVKRVIVHEKNYQQIVDGAKKIFEEQVMGDPLESKTTMGPLFAWEKSVPYLLELIKDAVDKGAKIITGGDVVTINKTNFLQPTILVDVTNQMRVMQEEPFGPVLPIIKVENDEQAVEIINDNPFGLTASIYTKSRERFMNLKDEIETGTIYANRSNFVDARLGWIGIKKSGNGSLALSPLGLKKISQEKSININPEFFN